MKTQMNTTSLRAYQELLSTGAISKMEHIVLNGLKKLGGKATNMQVSEYLNIPINGVTGRINGLNKKGYVQANKQVRNPVTGKLNWEWKITIN